jgi:hypothetical protein
MGTEAPKDGAPSKSALSSAAGHHRFGFDNFEFKSRRKKIRYGFITRPPA